MKLREEVLTILRGKLNRIKYKNTIEKCKNANHRALGDWKLGRSRSCLKRVKRNLRINQIEF